MPTTSLHPADHVFDEPTIGLHPHDIQRMNELLLRLRDKGNTVLVVEHKPEVIAIADHVVDLGPGAGTAGGEVVFAGSVAQLRKSGTVTGRHLSDRAALKPSVRRPSGVMKVRGRCSRCSIGLVDSGKSVIVIEHHLSVLAHADWIIDLGPGAGHDGGRIVFEGAPADLVAKKSTVTGQHLAEFVEEAAALTRSSRHQPGAGSASRTRPR